MDYRLDERWPADSEVRVTALLGRDDSGAGRVEDISKTGVCVLLQLRLSPGDSVQLEMADSVLFGTVAHSSPVGESFRVGIEVVQVLLGGTDMSRLLEDALRLMMPSCAIHCRRGLALADHYRGGVKAYSQAASALTGLPEVDFDHAWELAESARRACEQSRVALLHHQQEHGCLLTRKLSRAS
jgi:hypothetical protein